MRACEGPMRAPLPAGCRVRGSLDAREPPAKRGASARIICHKHFQAFYVLLARVLERKT